MRESSGIGIGVGGTLVVLFSAFAFLIAASFWLFMTVYTLVWSSRLDRAGDAAPAALVGLVGVVTLLVVGCSGGVALLGRSMSPPKSDRSKRGAASELS